MKTTVRKYKLTHYELRVAIDALNAKRLNQKSSGVDNSATSDLLLRFINALEA